MPSLKVIRTRIQSVKSTQKITRAMKMVAGARLARAQHQIVAMRPYAVKTSEILRRVSSSLQVLAKEQATKSPSQDDASIFDLLSPREEKKALFLVLSSDRGLCGAFNTTINKAAEREWKTKSGNGIEVSFATIGRKGREYLQRRGATVTRDFLRITEGLDLSKATEIGQWLTSGYQSGEWDTIYLIYNEFKSAISQTLTVQRLLPLSIDSESAPEVDEGAFEDLKETLYEPDPKVLLESLLPMYVGITVLRAIFESQASEFGARMTAMDAATRNAKDMISRLSLVYNRARQAAITKELMEIIGGAEALKD